MPTYRLTVEYEGTRYRGWQEQKNAKTVAGELRRAIEEAVGEKVEIGGSGRTDAGVHALGQVAHLKTPAPIRPGELARALEESLPADIQVLSIAPADDRFHARHAATSRVYLYQIARRRTALAKRFVWWVRRPLDVERMREAASALEGRHDFARFCERPEEQTSTVVVVERVEVVDTGALILVRIQASHFLWKMVRRLIGALVEAGAGAIAPAEVAALVADAAGSTPSRFDPAAATAPPSGLFLERVIYPGEREVAALAAATPIEVAPPASPSSELAQTSRAERSSPAGRFSQPGRPSRPAGRPPRPPRPSQPVQGSRPAQPAHASRPAQPSRSSQPPQTARPSQPTERSERSQPARRPKPFRPGAPRAAHLLHPSRPAKPADPARPSHPPRSSPPAHPAPSRPRTPPSRPPRRGKP